MSKKLYRIRLHISTAQCSATQRIVCIVLCFQMYVCLFCFLTSYLHDTLLIGQPLRNVTLKRLCVYRLQVTFHTHYIQGFKNKESNYLTLTNFNAQI